MRKIALAAALAAAAVVPVLSGAAERWTVGLPSSQINLVSPADDERPASLDAGDAPVPTDPEATGAIPTDDPASEPLDTAVWIGKPIISADGVMVGIVDDVQLDAHGRPLSISTTIGGFFGIGGTQVRLPAARARFDDGEVRLALVETDVSALAATTADRRVGSRPVP